MHPQGEQAETESVHPEGEQAETESVHPEGEQAETESVHPEGEQAETESVHSEKIMQLRIPLLKPAVFTQTIKIVTEEILEENPPQSAYNEVLSEPTLNEEIPEENPLQTAYNEVLSEPTQLHPTINDEIPEEIIQKILDELRQDPELHNVMDELEQQVEVEQLDMSIDISDDERLEQELNWEFW